MQVTKGTWCMREQCVPGSLSSSPAQEPGNEANVEHEVAIAGKGAFLLGFLIEYCRSGIFHQ